MFTTACSCGFTVRTETAEEGYQITYQHFLDEINTHTISAITRGIHLHIPKKTSWLKRLITRIKGKNK